jgi:hypothetical protein
MYYQWFLLAGRSKVSGDVEGIDRRGGGGAGTLADRLTASFHPSPLRWHAVSITSADRNRPAHFGQDKLLNASYGRVPWQ